MELSQEFIESNGLTAEQISALKGYVENDYIPTLKKEWDDKANKNAEGILSGASKYASEKIGIELEREKGEKFGDYFNRLVDKGLESKKSELSQKQAEIEEKLKNFKGGDEYKQQLEQLRSEKDALLQQVAELEPLKGLDEKYQEASQKLSEFKIKSALNSVKPSFPKEANTYEVKAKWDEFTKNVLNDYNIEEVDGEWVAVSKENQYKQVKLNELVEKDQNITELLKGRQQGGTGAKPISTKKVDGIPFDVPQEADSVEISKLVREHLIQELGSTMHKDYSSKFQAMLSKIKSAK